MSEFSESYHLRTGQAEDAIDLLRRVNRRGYVYAPCNGWVTFLVAGSAFEPEESIIAAAVYPLLHYVFAEDYGWGFSLYDRDRLVSRYRCDWEEEDIQIDDSHYSRAALEQLIPSVQPRLLDTVEQWLHPQDQEIDDLLQTEPSKLFAEAVGLVHYNWLAYDYIARDLSNSPDQFPEITEVSGNDNPFE